MKTLFLVTLSLLLSVSTFASLRTSKSTHFKKVVWIVFENENYSSVAKQADFAKWAAAGATFTNMDAEVHPSQGNYIAMVAGSAMGIVKDNNVDLNISHIGDLLEKNGMSWRVYAENYPGNCFAGASSGTYARKHVPFMSFTNVSGDPKRCAYIENEKRFVQDLSSMSCPGSFVTEGGII